MKTLAVDLPEEVAARLERAADKLGVSAEDLVRSSVEEKLTQLDDQFKNAADYVLAKNAELYKRLA